MKNLRRWWWLLLLIPIAIGLTRLRFDTEVLNLLPAGTPVVEGLKVYQQHFSGARDLLIAVEGDDPDQLTDATRALAELIASKRNLAGDIVWQPPWSTDVRASAELVAAMWLNQPPETFREVAERLSGDGLNERLADATAQLAVTFSPDEIARLAHDPLGLLNVPGSENRSERFGNDAPFVSGDGTFRVMFVTPATPGMSYPDATVWVARIRGTIADWRVEHPGFNANITGGPVFLTEIAGGMERDMTRSVLGTAAIAAVLFFAVYRRLRPLLWLLAMLGLVLLGAVAGGGLLLGRVNVVSIGFAAILLGLAVDYGLVLYQEHRAGKTTDGGRSPAAAGIVWSALTTAGAFLLLNFGGLPGLGELGTLVAVGVLLAALIMVTLYPRTFAREPESPSIVETVAPTGVVRSTLPLTFVLIAAAVIALTVNFPRMDTSSDALRPKDSPAYEVMETINDRVGMGGSDVWLVVQGESESDVASTLGELRERFAEPDLQAAVEDVTLPDALWPTPEHQRLNRPALTTLLNELPTLRTALADAGFEWGQLGLYQALFTAWERAAESASTYVPDSIGARWVLNQAMASDSDGHFALGRVTLNNPDAAALLGAELNDDKVRVAGWSLLGPTLLAEVSHRLLLLSVIAAGFVLVALRAAFGRWREVGLSAAAALVGGLFLLAFMGWMDWEWNMMNLLAVPLLLGVTVDYGIHMQLALRRHRGQPARAFATTGRALLMCAATTVAAFASLAWSNNAGLAGLGRVCAAGVAAAAFTAVILLPGWWWRLASRLPPATSTNKPSTLYGPRPWRFAVDRLGGLPPAILRPTAGFIARLYGRLQPERRAVVEANVLPIVDHDAARAREVSVQLFAEFGHKLADLWRFESGGDVVKLFHRFEGKEHLATLQNPDQGALLVTIHLGNWEFGAPLLARHDVKLLVLTRAEPGAGFTEFRERARARWGIETLVVGDDAFAFVEIIKRLQAGAKVALLLDRPPAGRSVEVPFLGGRLPVSPAAAELARATGCAVLPVVVPREPAGYAAHILPPVAYDRAALGDHAARKDFTAEIMRAFEPFVRQHPDQWFHFVQVWPADSQAPSAD